MAKVRKTQAEVDIFVGGGWYSKLAAVSSADRVLVIDNHDDLAGLPEHARLYKLALCEQDTVLSLLDRLQATLPAVGDLLEKYRHRPNAHLSSGAAHDPWIGWAAVRDLSLRGDLEKVFDRLFTGIFSDVGGELHLLTVRVWNSKEGGTGSLASHEVGDRLCEYFEARTTAKIRWHMLWLGGLTYLPIVPNPLVNTGRTVKHDVDALLAAAGHPRRLWELEVYEAPLRSIRGAALGDDRETRAILTSTLGVARTARELSAMLDTRHVNEKTSGPYGAMLRVQVDWSRVLDSEHIVGAAASRYFRELQRLREEPADRSVVIRVEVRLESTGRGLPEVEEVMAAVHRCGPEAAVLDAVLGAEPPGPSGSVWLWVSHEQAVSLERWLGTPGRPASLDDCRTVLTQLRGILARVEEALGAADVDVVTATRRLEVSRRALRTRTRRLRTLWYHLDLLLQTRAGVSRRLRATVARYRDAHDHFSQVRGRANALLEATESVRQALKTYEAHWIDRPSRPLERLSERGPVTPAVVEHADLAEIYPTLLDAVLSESDVTLRTFLMRAVSYVTMAGLAVMLDTDPEPAAVIRALDEGRFQWSSPPWGGEGQVHDAARHRFVVFPPLADTDVEHLRKAADERRFTPTLTRADTAAAGCCVVALSFLPVAHYSEILPPLYAYYAARGEDVHVSAATA